MSAFKFEIANVYNNLTNIVIRVAPKGSTAKAVLVNSHYDSTLGTPDESSRMSHGGLYATPCVSLVRANGVMNSQVTPRWARWVSH